MIKRQGTYLTLTRTWGGGGGWRDLPPPGDFSELHTTPFEMKSLFFVGITAFLTFIQI